MLYCSQNECVGEDVPKYTFFKEIFDVSRFSLQPVCEMDSTIILRALGTPFYHILGKEAITQHC